MEAGLRDLKIELPNSHHMVGVPDASRSIPPGCVVALGPNGVPVIHSMAVLMYRAPGHLPEDVVKAEAVWPPQVIHPLANSPPVWHMI